MKRVGSTKAGNVVMGLVVLGQNSHSMKKGIYKGMATVRWM